MTRRHDDDVRWVDDARAALRRVARGRAAELFARIARRARLADLGAAGPSRIVERGLAVRVAGERPGTAGFAATTTADRDELARVVATAAARPGPDAVPLARVEGSTVEDGRPASLPEAAELDAWRSSVGWIVRQASGARATIVAATVEVAAVTECVAGAAGGLAVRHRARCWGVVDVVARGGAGPIRRAVVRAAPDARGLPDLHGLDGWVSALADAADRPRAPAGTAGAWRLVPDAAGTLVRALALTIHAEGARPFRVGPAWRLTDDPRAGDATVGGAFDDVGRPTVATRLADGVTGFGRIGADGPFWRPSFRDPPAPRPAHLVVDATVPEAPGASAPDALDVVDLRAVPLTSDRWVLEALARTSDGGAALVRRVVSPRALASGCRGALGPARATADDVTTPGLVVVL